MAHSSYLEREVLLGPGDTVLLMSDGFPELADSRGKPLGYAAVLDLFAAEGGLAPQELISKLASAAQEWSGDLSPSDDITFVALRVKS